MGRQADDLGTAACAAGPLDAVLGTGRVVRER